MSATELEIPTRLPVGHLSASSLSLFMRCPEAWRRRYVEREYEPPVGAMILGSSIGAAENHADQLVVDGETRPCTEDVLDLYAAEFDERSERDEVDWGVEKPGEVKDVGVLAVKSYEHIIVPTIEPVSVEREFWLQFEGVDWGLQGFIDLEEADGGMVDRKVRKAKLSQADANKDLQAGLYLLARRAECNPAPQLRFDTMVRTKRPYAERVPTVRSERQLDRLIDRVYRVAAEMSWRLEHDIWAYAPPLTWFCDRCGYAASCPGANLP